jgi:hypothetical protein
MISSAASADEEHDEDEISIVGDLEMAMWSLEGWGEGDKQHRRYNGCTVLDVLAVFLLVYDVTLSDSSRDWPLKDETRVIHPFDRFRFCSEIFEIFRSKLSNLTTLIIIRSYAY